MAGYKNLEVSEQVRVNAVIIAAFEKNIGGEQNPVDGFVTRFRTALKEVSTDRTAGFQVVLDRLRDVLANDIKNIPTVKENDIADQNDLNAQMVLLRNLRGVMGQEKTGREFKASEIGQKVVDLKKTAYGDNKNASLPELVAPYKESNKMLIAVSCLKTFGDVQCPANVDTIITTATPVKSTGRTP